MNQILSENFAITTSDFWSVGDNLSKFSIAFKDLLINFGVNNENICAIMVIKIPSEKLYLYLMKYLFK